MVELFGLPGSGKTTALKEFVRSQKISNFSASQRILHLLLGFRYHPRFVTLLLLHRVPAGYSLRPPLVLAERLGVYYRYQKSDLYFDECVLQFVWRSICELPYDKRLDEKILSFLNETRGKFIYVKAPREVHISHILKRKKIQRFDQSVIDGSYTTYTEGRIAMARLLRILRQSSWHCIGTVVIRE